MCPIVDDPEMTLVELMRRWPTTIGVFLRHGMLCIGCAIGPFHTVADACDEYGLDETRFRDELCAAGGRLQGNWPGTGPAGGRLGGCYAA